ncbi:hypothetical protein Tco_0211884 [Tanacetum coccineum]
MHGSCKVINDIQFKEMQIGDLFEVVKRNDRRVDDNDPNNVVLREESDVSKGNFIGTRDDPIPPLSGRYNVEESDSHPEDDVIDTQYKVRDGVKYPTYNPETSWKEFKPVLDMKFENPQ